MPPDLAAMKHTSSPDTAPPPAGALGGKTWLIAAGAGVLLIGIIAIVSAFVLGARTSSGDTPDAEVVVTDDASSTTKPPTPVDDRVKEAIAMIDRGDYRSGIERLEALLPDVDDREDVHKALFVAYASTDQPKEALREAKSWLRTNPNLDITKEEKLRVEVRNDALLREGPIANDVFAILEGPMGSVGWDDVYDIAFGAAGAQYPKAADRAKRDILKGERKRMSEALAVTADLHAVGASCAAKQYFDRAADKGDERTSFLLKQWVAPRIVGHFRRQDILGCIHEGSLAKTIQAIDDRVRTQKKK
jgi:hypothetical protein